jgi:hypothetical protein
MLTHHHDRTAFLPKFFSGAVIAVLLYLAIPKLVGLGTTGYQTLLWSVPESIYQIHAAIAYQIGGWLAFMPDLNSASGDLSTIFLGICFALAFPIGFITVLGAGAVVKRIFG